MKPILSATVGRKKFPVMSWKQVSDAYVSMIKASGAKLADVPSCHLLDEFGQVVAHVATTGRIWNMAGGLIYDPRLTTRH
jgi:hypothetical protein